VIYRRYRRKSEFIGFRDLVEYVTTREDALDGQRRIPDEDIALRNLDGLDTAVADMDAAASRRHARCKDPSFHATISWRPGETPTREEMFLAADELLRELGMEDSQAVYSIHRDTDNLHVHIAASRVSMRDFRIADLKGDYRRGERVMRESELRFGREHDVGKYYEIKNGRVVEIDPNRYVNFDISDDALRREVRHGKLSFQTIVLGEPRDAIATVLDDPNADWATLTKTLKRYDLQYRLYRNRFGEVVGGQIVDASDPEHKHVSASKMDPRLAYKRVIERFDLPPDLDGSVVRFSTSTYARFEEYAANALRTVRDRVVAAAGWDQLQEIMAGVGLRYSWEAGKGARIHDVDDDARTVTPTTLGKGPFRWLRYTELKARFGHFRVPEQRVTAPGDIAAGQKAAHAGAGTRERHESPHYDTAGEQQQEGRSKTWSERAAAKAADDERAARSATIALDPTEVLDELTRHEAVFTAEELAEALAEATVNGEDLMSAFHSVADRLVKIPGYDNALFTTVAMREEERELDRHMEALAREAAAPLHVDPRHLEGLDDDQRKFVLQAASGARLTFARGAAGAGKSFALGRVKAVFEDNGWEVIGCSLASVAAERLQTDSGIESTSNAALLYRIGVDPETIGPNTLLVMDEANLTGTRQANAIYRAIRERGARITGAGDEGQLKNVEAGNAFQRYTHLYPDRVAELSTPRRQASPRDLAATKALFERRFRAGIKTHLDGGTFSRCADNTDLHERLMSAWDAMTRAEPDALVWVQSSRNWVVDDLNERAHEIRHGRGELSNDSRVRITLRRNDKVRRDVRAFAVGERVRFGKNENLHEHETGEKVPVKNGTLGTVEAMDVIGKYARSLRVRLDSGRTVKVALDSYSWIDYGYAGTDYKGEGLTAKHTLWAVGKYDDAHNATVGLTRHTHSVHAFYSAMDYADEADLVDALSAPNYKRSSLQYDIPEHEAPTIQAPAAPAESAPTEDVFARTLRERGITLISREEFARKKYDRRAGRVVDKLIVGGLVHLLLEYEKGRATHVMVPNSLAAREVRFGAILRSDGETVSKYEQPGSMKGPRLDL